MGLDEGAAGAREAGREGRDLARAMARPRVRDEAGGVLNPKGEPDEEESYVRKT